MHEFPLITTIAAGFTAAWVLGLLTQWLRLSPIVGYLLAGVLIGPHTPGFQGDLDLAHQLAEVGRDPADVRRRPPLPPGRPARRQGRRHPGGGGAVPGRDRCSASPCSRGSAWTGQDGGRARHGHGRGEHGRADARPDGRRRAGLAGRARRRRVVARPGRADGGRPGADPRPRDRGVRRRRCARAGLWARRRARPAQAGGPGRGS